MGDPIQDWLEENGIDFRTHGKNVGPNDINVQCLYCGDEGYHLGISRNTGQLYCWVCKFEHMRRKPWLGTLIQDLLKVPYSIARREAKEIISQLDHGTNRSTNWSRPADTILPQNCMLFFEQVDTDIEARSHRMARSYLAQRGFTDDLIRKHLLMFTPVHRVGTMDPYSGRIIIPYFFNHELVTWAGRDYTGHGDTRYRNCPVEKAVMRFREVIYGIDEYKSSNQQVARVVEGVFDKLTLGPSALSVSKGGVGVEQSKILRDLKPAQITWIFDPATSKDPYSISRAIKAAQDLSPWVKRQKVVRLHSEDVNSLGAQAVLEAERSTPLLQL